MNGVDVYVRISPFRPVDQQDSNILDSLFNSHKCLRIINPRPSSSENHRVDQYDISKIKNVFESTVSNQQVYQETIYPHLFHSPNPLFMVYGQTGSGKTYTLLGPIKENRFTGVLPLALQQILRQNAELHLSAIQIYNNKIYDLQYANFKKELMISECGDQLFFRENPSECLIKDPMCLFKWFQKIKRNQVIGNTTLNDQSSRSHTIFFVRYRPFNKDISYRLTAVDLAGNERARYSNINNKEEKLESIHINKSLFALKECIRASKLNQRHIPYRRSILTMFLKNFLIQNSRILFLTTINPSKKCYHDIINSIEYSIYLVESNIHKTVQKLLPAISERPMKTMKNKTIKPCKPQPINHITTHHTRPPHLNHRKLVKTKLPPISLTTNYEYKSLLKIYFNYIMNVYKIARIDRRIYEKMAKKRYLDKNELLERIQQKKDMLEKFQEAIINL